MRRLAILWILFILLPGHPVRGCFILFLSDGKQVIVGNHEDWFAKDAAVKINVPASGKFGSVIFTFMSEGWAQGGMNEKGLFFDAAQTPFQEVSWDRGLESYRGYIWQAVLDKCSTVDEAVVMIRQFSLPDLNESHIMLADAGGHAALVGVKDGKVVIKHEVNGYLMQTNFNPWQPELSDEPVCPRYAKGEEHLAVNKAATIENMKSILKETHQDSLTVYSNIYDLKNRSVITYRKLDFEHGIEIGLPEFFRFGNCIRPLDSLLAGVRNWDKCKESSPDHITISGKVIDGKSSEPVPYVNIGLTQRNVGTLSDPDGTFVLDIPVRWLQDTILFSSIGYEVRGLPPGSISRMSGGLTVRMQPRSMLLNEVTIKGKKIDHRTRLGWMGGKDGILPFDTIQGGGVAALLVEAPSAPGLIEKLQVRLMYNSKDTLKFRFHIYSYDSVNQIPGVELLNKSIILRETKRFGWLRFDLAGEQIAVPERRFCIGFEWIDDRQTRQKMLTGLQAWEKWRRAEFEKGNPDVEKKVVTLPDGTNTVIYKYHGNMMHWPGFKDLPPFTGLMIETGKHSKTAALRTFQRKTSFGKWEEVGSTLNAVVTVSY